MANRKLIMLTILFIALVAVSGVSAADNATDFVGTDEANIDDIAVEPDYDSAGVEDTNILEEGSAGSFSELYELLFNASEDTVSIDKDYQYDASTDEGFKNGIDLKTVTIEGNGHIIDGKGQARIFNIIEDNVTINNLKLINGYAENGGAINSVHTLICNNITFENNHATGDGGAIFIMAEFNITDCIFDGNYAKRGAAIYISYLFNPPIDNETDDNGTDDDDEGDDYNDTGDYNGTEDDPTDDGGMIPDSDAGNDDDPSGDDSSADDEDSWDDMVFSYIICNSIFKNSHNVQDGLIYSDTIDPIKILYSTFANSTSVNGAAITAKALTLFACNNSFTNLHSSLSGGAVSLFMSTTVHFENCSFINTSSCNNGGAICADVNGDNWDSSNRIIVKNSEFKGSKSDFGGVIAQFGGELFVVDSIFENNYAQYSGGAIITSFCKSKIRNSTFKNNKLDLAGSGGAINVFDGELYVNGSRFINNSYNAIYSCQNIYEITNSFFNNNTQAIYSIYLNSSVLNSNEYTNDILAENSTDPNYYVFIINSTGIQIALIDNDIDVSNLPTRFDSRDWGWVTPVKDQGESGACWVFATCSALEASILKSMGAEYNISVNNIQKNLLKYSRYGHALFTESGYPFVAGEYILSWYGAVSEEYSPFDRYGKFSRPIITSDAFHIQDILWLSGRQNATDNDEIKKAILKYGAVTSGVSMYGDSPYFNVNTSALYVNTGRSPSGHAICIVGWDDNYPASNFILTPPGDGAWIVKNSYGPSKYDNGYIYVSYYDDIIGYEPNDLAFIFENTENYNKNYQTDIGGEIVIINETGEYAYKNVYTSIDDDFISAVGTYFSGEGEVYSLEIYVNDNLKHTQNGVAPFRGFHTVKLAKYIPVRKGDTFAVVMKKSSMPILNMSQQHFRIGDSFVLDGNSWYDLSLDNTTASLKVYTKPLENLKPAIKAVNVNTVYNGGKFLTVSLKDVYGDALKGVKVTIRLSNGYEKTLTTDSKGEIKFSTNGLSPKTYTATITTNAFGKYIKTVSSAKIVVKKATPKLTTKSKTFKKSVKTKKYKITLKDNRNKVMKNIKVTIKVNKKTYVAKTNSKGVATFKITKLSKKGKYVATVVYKGSSYFNKVTKKVKIKIR